MYPVNPTKTAYLGTGQQSINAPTQAIASKYPRWRKNRAFLDGQDAVKEAGELYLPKVRVDDVPAEYQAHKTRTNFHPAASKIAQGMCGLINSKRPHLNSTVMVQVLSQSISVNGDSLDDLAEFVTRETLITNFTGLLVDHPARGEFQDLNAENALRRGFRPYINAYCAESILEVTQGLVGHVTGLTSVRLLERDGHRVRHLLLNDEGNLEVRVYDDAEDHRFSFTAPPTVTVPLRDGKPLRTIPFFLVSTTEGVRPKGSPIEASVDLNHDHYCLSGNLASITQLCSAPILTITGYTPDEDDPDFKFDISGGAVIAVKEPTAKIEWHDMPVDGAKMIMEQMKSVEDRLSTLGHSLVAPEKAAPEAPETHLIRRAAENAILAGLVRQISRALEDALRELARWTGDDTGALTYALNSDFLKGRLTDLDLSLLEMLNARGLITDETLMLLARDNGTLSQALDVDKEIALAREQQDSRPLAGI